MKIIKVNLMEGEARFVIEGDTSPVTTLKDGKAIVTQEQCTRCIKLTEGITKQEIIDKLKSMITPPVDTESIYNNLKLKDLKGTDI